MKQKIFLTSALAMGFVAPAMAEPSNTGDFPSTGLMQEDYTYTGAATEANMGVYEGTVNATAEYTDDLYNIVAGNYLEAGSEDENGTQCTAGNFCPGLTNALYNETTDQGLNSCSDATNGIYTLSAAGASSQNECYRECTTADVAHSRGTLNGGYYYGDSNQCGATDCVDGWHVKPSLDLVNTIGTATGVNASVLNNGSATDNISTYGLTSSDIDTWVADFGEKGILRGKSYCSALSGTEHQTTKTTSELGDYSNYRNCWCNVTSYTPVNGNTQNLSSLWVLFSDWDNDGPYGLDCDTNCAFVCGIQMARYPNNRSALLNSVTGFQPEPASCEANIININWSNADAADISANNAGTATYDSDIRTPVKAQTIKGKTFRGWRFSKPEQTTTGN